MNKTVSRYLRYLPIMVLGIVVFALSLFMDWDVDSIHYAYVQDPVVGSDYVSMPLVRNLSDIWHSQITHYYIQHGRFVVHFIVQIFCGLVGQWPFAICNALVWMVLALMMFRVARYRDFGTSDAVIVSALLIILFNRIKYDPPFQLCYVWMSLGTLIWIYLFAEAAERKRRALFVVLVALFSLLVGNGHEGFSIPIGGAILWYAYRCKFRLSREQWIYAIAYGVGSIVGIISPGNWRRAGVGVSHIDMLKLIEQMLYILPIPIIFAVQYFSLRRRRRLPSDENDSIWREEIRLIVPASVVCILFFLALIKSSPVRGLHVLLLMLTVQIVHGLAIWRRKRMWAVLFGLGAIAIVSVDAVQISAKNEADRDIYSAYGAGSDGVAYVTDAHFANRYENYREFYNCYRAKSETDYPGRPPICVRPESMRRIESLPDTNMVMDLGDGLWLLVQSKRHPARFVIERRLLPGLLDRRISDRLIEMSPESGEVFDSIGDFRIGAYYNGRRPVLDIKVRVAD